METALIETFPNPHPHRDYVIEHVVEEFTSLCPKTGHPDFGRITIRYIARDACIELKSLKLYLHQYRTQGIFYEDVTNQLLTHFIKACDPRWMLVQTRWTGRGGIRSTITAQHGNADEIDLAATD